MSAAERTARPNIENTRAAISSGAAFQYVGAFAVFVMGAIGSLITQVGIFASAYNVTASVVVALVLNVTVALIAVSVYAFAIEDRPPKPVWVMLVTAAAIGVFRIWLSHQLQQSVGIESLLQSNFGYVAGALQGLLWFVPMSLFFHNRDRFNRERRRLLAELVDNQLRERRRALLTTALTEELTKSVAARVAESVSETRLTLANALTFADSTMALRGVAQALRTTIDRDIRPMSKELWSKHQPMDVTMGWRTLLKLSCYDRPFALFLSTVMTLGLGLPLSMSLPHPGQAVLFDFLQVGVLIAFLAAMDRYVRALGSAAGYWTTLFASGFVAIVPSVYLWFQDWSQADLQFWAVTALVGVPLLVFFSSVVNGLAGTREAVLERVRTYVDEAAVADEVRVQEMQQVNQALARHLHSSLQGRLMAISLELDQAASEGRGDAMGAVLQRLDTLLDAPLVGAFQASAVDVEAALVKLIDEWSAVADVTLDLRPNWSGELEQGQLIVGIAEEAIANAVRHGHATDIRLQVVGSGTDVIVTIDNNGVAPVIGKPGLGTRWLDQVSKTDWALRPLPNEGMRLQVRLADAIPVEHS